MSAVYADSVTVTNFVATRPATTDGPEGWVDGLDTTYANVWREGHSPTPSSIFDIITATFPATNATDVTPFARLAVYLDESAVDNHNVAFEINDASDPGAPFVGWFRPFTSLGTLPSAGTIYDADVWSWEDQYGGGDKTRLLSVLAAGNLTMHVQPPILPSGWEPGMLWGLFIYEFALNVKRAAPSPLRLYPRTRRLYPPPESRRVAGGFR